MLASFTTRQKNTAIPIFVIAKIEFPAWLTKQSSYVKNWLTTSGFRGEAGNISLIPDKTGKLEKVISCVSDAKNFWCVGSLPVSLPEGVYYFEKPFFPATHTQEFYQNFAIAWGLGGYQFDRYKQPLRKPAQLFLPKEAN